MFCIKNFFVFFKIITIATFCSTLGIACDAVKSSERRKLQNVPPCRSLFVASPELLDDYGDEDIDLQRTLPPSITRIEVEPLLGIHNHPVPRRLILRSQLIKSLLEIDPFFFTHRRTQELIRGLKSLYQMVLRNYADNDVDKLSLALYILTPDQRTFSLDPCMILTKTGPIVDDKCNYFLSTDITICRHRIPIVGAFIANELKEPLCSPVASCDSPIKFSDPPVEFRPISLEVIIPKEATKEEADLLLGIHSKAPLPQLILRAELASSFLDIDCNFFTSPETQVLVYDIKSIYWLLLNAYAANDQNAFISALFNLPQEKRAFEIKPYIAEDEVLLGFNADVIDSIGVAIARQMQLPLKAERERKSFIETIRKRIQESMFSS